MTQVTANFKVLFFSVLLIASSFCLLTVAGQTEQGDSMLQDANDSVKEAFIVILNAEQSGANITNLLRQLNGAAKLLASAEIAYRSGNSTSAINSANNVILIAQQVMVDSKKIEANALVYGQEAFIINVAQTIIASAIFLAVLAMLWLILKNKYIKNLMQSTPEVNNDNES